MSTIKIYTERDLRMLYDLYKFRALTTSQLKSIHFEKNKDKKYLYYRIHQFKKENLVESRPLIGERGKKIASCFYLTDEGIALLEKQGYVEEGSTIRSKDLRVDGAHLPYLIDTNEIYARIHHDWSMLDSREVKRKYAMNRGNLIQGSLINAEEKEFGIYILQEKPEDNTLVKIMKEIKSEALSHYFIFCKGASGYSYFKFKEILDYNRFASGKMVGILPYEFGIEVLRRYPKEWDFVNLFTQYGQVRKLESKYAFTQYSIIHNGEEKFIVNGLVGDYNAQHLLKRYGYDRYQIEKKKVMLFAWEGQANKLQEEFIRYPHIEIIALGL